MGEKGVVDVTVTLHEQMRGYYDTEFNVDWFDQLIGYSPVSRTMWPCDERGHTQDLRITS